MIASSDTLAYKEAIWLVVMVFCSAILLISLWVVSCGLLVVSLSSWSSWVLLVLVVAVVVVVLYRCSGIYAGNLELDDQGHLQCFGTIMLTDVMVLCDERANV